MIVPQKSTQLIAASHRLVAAGFPRVEYEENIQRLRDNAQALGAEREKGPPREGPALLQGLVVCAQCGERMTERYHQRGGCLVPEYMRQARSIQRGRRVCQQIPGAALDVAIGKLLVDTVTPLTLEVAFAVQTELENRCDEAERLHLQEVERAGYQSDLARLRFMRVDPSNRLVADSLEAEWNQVEGTHRGQGALRRAATERSRARRAACGCHSPCQRFPLTVERSAHTATRAQANGTAF